MSGWQKRRTLEETFNLVKNAHIGLCHDPKYHKVPFSERDKVVAGLLHLYPAHVSLARRGEGCFKRFYAETDSYLHCKEYLPAGKLTEIVDYYFAWLRAQPKNAKKLVSGLDTIMAKDLGYVQRTIRSARLGRAAGRKLGGCVNPEHRVVSYPGARVTYNNVRDAYERLMRDPEFRDLHALERDAHVAQKLNLSKHTVTAARNGSGSYKAFTGFYRRLTTQVKYNLVRDAYLRLMCGKAFAGLPVKKRDNIVAKEVGLNVHSIIAIRTGNRAYAVFDRFMPVGGSAKQTCDKIKQTHYELMQDAEFVKLTIGSRDNIIAEKLGLSRHTVAAVRTGKGSYKHLGGLATRDLEKERISVP